MLPTNAIVLSQARLMIQAPVDSFFDKNVVVVGCQDVMQVGYFIHAGLSF